MITGPAVMKNFPSLIVYFKEELKSNLHFSGSIINLMKNSVVNTFK